LHLALELPVEERRRPLPIAFSDLRGRELA
jgi:hypothetical protein